KKAPKMNASALAVFGLGDTSYEYFSQAGKDVDGRLAELGAERLLERVDADVEYAAEAQSWRQRLPDILTARVPQAGLSQITAAAAGSVNEIYSSP
ncbi:flavodoxin domain-containing protein, partial [Erwinia amylovora]|uniref:flavodoxin domain-containing protein n=1 Tax=Erwinia amylovora TaxID=552 RepID=UPI00200B631E